MTNENQLPDVKATQAFLSWVEEGKKVWDMYEQSGLSVPPTLKRAFSEELSSTGKNRIRPASVRPPDRPDAPSGTEDDWIWIPAKDVSARMLVLALLNGKNPIPVRDIINSVKEILPTTPDGSVYNIGAQEKKIQKTDDGWKLIAGAKAPVLHKSFVWGPREVFQKQDLAAFRRFGIRHLLAITPGGLQVVQISKQLQNADWLRTPLSKDLVKLDLFLMKKHTMVKQQGNSKKWILHPSFKEGQ